MPPNLLSGPIQWTFSFINWLCYTRDKSANINKFFYDSLYQQKASILIATFPKTEIGPLADTYSYADWQNLQWLPVTPTFASPVQWDKAEELTVSRSISRRPHTTGRGNSGLNIQIDSIGFGGSRIEQNHHPIFFNTLFLYLSYFLEFIGQFLQPPAFGHKQAKPSLARPLWP